MRAVSKLSKYLRNPSPNYIDAANYLLVYVVRTKYLVIEYDGFNLDPLKEFMVTSDASYADTEDRKSSYGYCLQLYGGVIYYKASI